MKIMAVTIGVCDTGDRTTVARTWNLTGPDADTLTEWIEARFGAPDQENIVTDEHAAGMRGAVEGTLIYRKE